MNTTMNNTPSARQMDDRLGDFWRAFHKRFPWCTPTMLTLSRVLMIFPAIFCMAHDWLRPYTLIPLMWITLFDIFDGTLARVADQRTRFGGFFDQAVDKGLTLCLLFWHIGFFVVGDVSLTYADGISYWIHVGLLGLLFLITLVCDLINFSFRCLEAGFNIQRHWGALWPYWFSFVPEKSAAERDQVSSNAGKAKAGLLMGTVCVMSVSHSLASVDGYPLRFIPLLLVTATAAAIGLWLLPPRLRRHLSFVSLAGLMLIFVSALLLTIGPYGFWGIAEVLFLIGTIYALRSTKHQIRRRQQQPRFFM